jgi:hypothetical protein
MLFCETMMATTSNFVLSPHEDILYCTDAIFRKQSGILSITNSRLVWVANSIAPTQNSMISLSLHSITSSNYILNKTKTVLSASGKNDLMCFLPQNSWLVLPPVLFVFLKLLRTGRILQQKSLSFSFREMMPENDRVNVKMRKNLIFSKN